MRVIHGIWAHGALCLWAEDPELPSAAGATGSVPSGVRLPRPHPFACQAAELADLVAGWSGSASPDAPFLNAPSLDGPSLDGPSLDALGDEARKAVHDELILQLPTAGGGPLASPELVRPARDEPAAAAGPVRRGRVSLASWRVPVLAFGPAAALTVLATLGGPGQPDDPATASGSLAYLAAVARFASGLAERGRVLPVLAAEDGTLAARWRPVLGGADVQRARDLAAAMPPACRARRRRDPRAAAGRRPRCPGRRGRPVPAAVLAAARPARPGPGAAPGRRALRAGPDRTRRSRRGADGQGRRRGRRPGGRARRVAGRRADTGGPGPHLLPAGRTGSSGGRSLAGGVRAAVRGRSQPHGLRGRCLGRARRRDGPRR